MSEKKTQKLAENLLVIGRNYQILARSALNADDELKLTRLAIQNISTAAALSENKRFQAEACFYLAEIYQKLGEEMLMLRFANISRKLGFIPSLIPIFEYIEKHQIQIPEKQYVKILNQLVKSGFFEFQYDFRPSISERFKDALVSLVRGQGAKLYKTLAALDKVFSKETG